MTLGHRIMVFRVLFCYLEFFELVLDRVGDQAREKWCIVVCMNCLLKF